MRSNYKHPSGKLLYVLLTVPLFWQTLWNIIYTHNNRVAKGTVYTCMYVLCICTGVYYKGLRTLYCNNNNSFGSDVYICMRLHCMHCVV